ncbi:MAG TPA: hypothetical protein DIW17_10330 [Clostridiales bacterium]|nr:hypothetical protein [Clostridiales bacterium]
MLDYFWMLISSAIRLRSTVFKLSFIESMSPLAKKSSCSDFQSIKNDTAERYIVSICSIDSVKGTVD